MLVSPKFKHFLINGGIASTAAISCFPIVYPLDIIKKDMQMNSKESYRIAIRELYQQGGVKRFFKGMNVAALEVPASRFVSFGMAEVFRSTLPKEWDRKRSTKYLKSGVSAVVGSWTKAAIFCPIDSVKTRLQTYSRFEKGVIQPSNVKGILRQVYADNGIRGLYKGFTNIGIKGSLNFVPFLIGMDAANEFIPVPTKTNDITPNWLLFKQTVRDGLVGSSATMFSDIFTYPLGVIKNLRQATIKHSVASHFHAFQIKNGGRPPNSNIGIAKLIVKENGLSGLYRGFSARLLALFLGGFGFGITYSKLKRTFLQN